jgi:diaminopimelate decarboxylase
MVQALLARKDLLRDLVDQYGTPLNVVFPQVFKENATLFQQTLNRYSLRSRIFYAHKTNQSSSLVRAAADAGIDIDVASDGELRSAIAGGFAESRIEATGPKGTRFLRALVREGVTVNVDNQWELTELARLAEEEGGTVPVLLRLCPAGGRTSRFGIPANAMPDRFPEQLDLRGFSFHLDTNDLSEKVRAVDECLGLFEVAYAGGHSPRVLDIGGGFRQVFAADPDGFDRYVQALKNGLAGMAEPLSWEGNAFGYRRRDGEIRGTPVFHRYANTVSGPEQLAELLESPLPSQGRSIAQVLLETMIELWLEPGKALVDQAGITIASVDFTKLMGQNETLVSLDVSRDRVCPADQEVMLDPVVIHDGDPRGESVGVYFGGNLCLERDLVYAHKTWLENLPQPGDLVVFVNTAAYQMDLSASEALMHPKAPKVAAVQHDKTFTFHAESERCACSTQISPN